MQFLLSSHALLNLWKPVKVNDKMRNFAEVRLFADDTAMFLTMEGADDSSVLQQDLGQFYRNLTGTWSLTPQSARWCRWPINVTYRLHGEILKTVTFARYLGVDVSSILSRTRPRQDHRHCPQNSRNCEKKHTNQNVRCKSYNTLIVMQPFGILTIKTKPVQRRAAGWMTCNYDRRASVSKMLESLRWHTLE